MGFSPSFWVAVSFFIFVIVAWRFIRKAFLNTIHNYRNSVSSALNDLYARKAESEALVEKSHQELEDSNLNGFVLNAHKVAKDISERSKARVDEIKNATTEGVQKSALSVQDFLRKKIASEISEATSVLVKTYLNHHQAKFNEIAARNILEVLSKKSK